MKLNTKEQNILERRTFHWLILWLFGIEESQHLMILDGGTNYSWIHLLCSISYQFHVKSLYLNKCIELNLYFHISMTGFIKYGMKYFSMYKMYGNRSQLILINTSLRFLIVHSSGFMSYLLLSYWHRTKRSSSSCRNFRLETYWNVIPCHKGTYVFHNNWHYIP